jgi:hypothetical protein
MGRRQLGALAVELLLAGCASARVVQDRDVSHGAVVHPDMIYVADFDIEAGSIQSESRAGRLPRHRYREQQKAEEIVTNMGRMVVDELNGKGIPATLLPAQAYLPKQGWLVRGTFYRINEGDRAKRAMIGLGVGQTDLQLSATISDLSSGGAPMPLYEMKTDATSNKFPGAVTSMNPYAAIVKFALAGHDLDISAKQTAGELAAEIAAHVAASQERSP